MKKAQATPAAPTPAATAARNDPPPEVEYTIHENGDIFRTAVGEDSKHVANFARETGVLTVIEPRYMPYILRYVTDEDLKVLDVVKPAAPTAAVPAGVPTGTVPGVPNPHAVTPFYTPKPGMPPMPKIDKLAGDKTPAFVDYLFEHDRAEFNRRYRVIGEGQVTKWQVTHEPITNRPIRTPYKVTALLSERKTHRTEKPDASTGGEE